MNPTLPRQAKIGTELWTFWHEPFTPQWQAWASRFGKVTVLSPRDVPSWVSTCAPSLAAVSDWVRLKTLQDRGGVWLDATLRVNDGRQLEALIARSRDKLLGAYTLNSAMQTDRAVPVPESWCLIAPAESPLVALWLREFELALMMGFRAYREHQERLGISTQRVYDICKHEYLTIHACLQVVLRRHPEWIDRMELLPAETGPLALHVSCGWQASCIAKELDERGDLWPLVKIRGFDRKVLATRRVVIDALPYLAFLLICALVVVLRN